MFKLCLEGENIAAIVVGKLIKYFKVPHGYKKGWHKLGNIRNN